MATVTGLTADRMIEIESNSVVSGTLEPDGDLILTQHDGSTINAGNLAPTLEMFLPALLDFFCPVGHIYFSVNPTNPGTWMGGTWVAWGSGRVPVGVNLADAEFNTVEETGGAKTHALTVAELASHDHTIGHDHASATAASDGGHRHDVSRRTGVGSAAGSARGNASVEPVEETSLAGAHTHSVNIPSFSGTSGARGSGTAHNNLQPYITCYMFKRTA